MSKALQFKFPGMQPEAKPVREPMPERACEVCGGRAGFAYGHSELRNIEGRWRCFSHRFENERKEQAA